MSTQDVILWVITLVVAAGCITLWIRTYQVLRYLRRSDDDPTDQSESHAPDEVPQQKISSNGTYQDALTEHDCLFAGLDPIESKPKPTARQPSDAA